MPDNGEMRELVSAVRSWNEDDQAGAVVRPVEESGMGARRSGAALAISAAGDRAGGLYGGAADSVIETAAKEVIAEGAARLLDVELSDSDAVRAGLACGGRATLLLQPLGAVPAAWWEAITRPQGAALITPLGRPGPSMVVTREAVRGSLGEGGTASDVDEAAVRIARGRLAKARGSREIVEIAGASYVLEISGAAPHVIVVGAGELATALVRQATLLGWDSDVVGTAPQAQALFAANACLVVLSHDPAIDTPALAAALRDRIPYVGALGSRHTQSARAGRLRAMDLGDETIAAIHGPVGLALGARTPEETALAICAEILTVLSDRSATSLRDTTGAINA
jgi:xanthine dehydrogenase accessory factor